jgi:preprotein translocase subunit SecY
MPRTYQASSPAVAIPLEALSPAEPLHPSMGPRIGFTVAALVVYRLGTFIPIPGIDRVAFAEFFKAHSSGVLSMFNLFAGGAVERMAIFALNIMPYISALIIMQIVASLVPSLEALKREGEQGRKQINEYARYLTVALAALQAYAIARGLEGSGGSMSAVVIEPAPFFRISTVVTMVGGTIFLMWLGEQITARGIGNGSSLIILAGIVAEMPAALYRILEQGRSGIVSPAVILALLVTMIVVVAAVVFFERAQRRLTIQYPKRQVGNRMFQGDSAHLPLKLNCSGVIPPIFASSLLLLPITIAEFSADACPDWLNAIVAWFGRGQPLYFLIYTVLIVFFAFLYAPIVFNTQETAEDLRKHGGFVPGIRPGPKTAEYIDYVLTRITALGATYSVAVCVLPELLICYKVMAFLFSGSGLLIVIVGMLDLLAFTKRLFRLPPSG